VNESETVLRGVLDQWKAAVGANQPQQVAALFTEDVAEYRILETRQLADDYQVS
jgi:hypothetical protein